MNGTKYGKLYNWYAVNDTRGLAPAGWHVPTDQEWTVLSTFLGGEDVAGVNMKSSSGWSDNGNGNNSYGFSGLPAACRNYQGDFRYFGDLGNWWSASESDVSHAWFRKADSWSPYLYRNSPNKPFGFSVRLVKD
jgi:uncharacterized protein (TIGR02145 family)